MELVEQVLGNMSDEAWRVRLTAPETDVDWLELGQWDAQKNRLRKTTGKGLEVAVSRIHLCDVMVVSLPDPARRPTADVMETCVRLGHALGNQHWPAVIRDNAVYVPMSVDRKVMEAVMATHRLKDIGCSFIDGDKAAAMLDPQAARRHTHGHDHGHAHGPDDGRPHEHHHDHHDHHHHGPHAHRRRGPADEVRACGRRSEAR